MEKLGAFTFVLHSHIPYCRQAGRWPHGEEWLHEAASETYIPLLDSLYDLKESACAYKLTIGITPVLAEQLSDALVLQHLEEFIREKIRRADNDIPRFQPRPHPSLDSGGSASEHRADLARYYSDRYRHILDRFLGRFDGDITGAFRRLQDAGCIEIASSAATHGYLPLLERDSSIYAQLKTGIESYRRRFGRPPRALWLPECAYRSGYYASNESGTYVKPGLEAFLQEMGITCFFAETHTVEGGQPVGKALGDAIGPYGNIPKRYVAPVSKAAEPTLKTTYLPYLVNQPGVTVFGRNNRTGMQVWSADWGYPGDYSYREFHKRDGVSGLQYWRVTGAKVDLGAKELYYPEAAATTVAGHAKHYASLVADLLRDFHQRTGRFGIVSAAYDTELFGHWWFEGVDWIKQVLEALSQAPGVELTTASEFVQRHPAEDILALPEGSWGVGGGHFTWLNVDTEWMWPQIHSAEERMEALVARYPEASGAVRDVLDQAARELLLLQSSDWPFLVTTGQAREYAIERFGHHLDRFHRLAEMAESGQVDDAARQLAANLYELDKVFPDIDYRVFAEREGRAGEYERPLA
ncbi:MAG: DUF1957 domain-containing protein [Chloroflexi bacterium]|nr:DUF1957 domain-containing protein [Chloroflexota bacterium]